MNSTRSQQMKEALVGVESALQYLIDVWDQELVVYFPEEIGELTELKNEFEGITIGDEEESLAKVLAVRNPGLQMEIMSGSGALFIYTDTVLIGVDRNLGDSWNVQFYPNPEDSESYNLDLGFRAGREPTVFEVAKELEPILLALTKRNAGAKITDHEAVNEIAKTLAGPIGPDGSRLDAIRGIVTATGRETA